MKEAMDTEEDPAFAVDAAVGDWLRAKDSYGTWHDAKIIELKGECKPTGK